VFESKYPVAVQFLGAAQATSVNPTL
jgi:hypothetical protein